MQWDTEDAWFRPKRYGYGAGLPIKWQGWAICAAMLLACLAAGTLLPHWLALPVILLLAAGFIAICRAHTQGGWSWRWGARRW